MKKLILVPALLAGSLALADQHKYEISPMIGYDFADSGIKVKDDGYLTGGVEVQFNTPGSKISPEFSVLYSQGVENGSQSSIAGQKSKVIRGMFNGVYTFDETMNMVPFAKLGAGIEKIGTPSTTLDDGFMLDAGVGAKVPFTKSLALKLEAIYMAKMSSDNDGTMDTNLVTLVGLTYAFGGDDAKKAAPVAEPTPAPVAKKVVATPVVAPVVIEADDDKDGVVNSLDKCPNTIADAKVDANGCNLDSDSDGVLNSMDACANTPAGTTVDAKGCEEDKDKDGVLNAQDLCPNTEIGEAVNSDGCPKTITLNVNFGNNSANIQKESFAQLDAYVAFLTQYTNYSAKIVGYTDSRGSAVYNQKLSEKRANAVVKYMIDKGVKAERLSAKGAGEVNPIADNSTAEGRAQNRRIEAELIRN